MNEDGDQPQSTGSSRDTLAASTLRALRAGNRGGRTSPPAVPPDGSPEGTEIEPETAEADLADETQLADEAELDAPDPAAEVDTSVVDEPEVDSTTPDETKSETESETEPETDTTVVDEPESDTAVVEDPETDTAVDDEASPVEAAPGKAPARRRRSSLLTAACAVLAVAALVFAVVSGVIWYTSGHSGQHGLAAARNQVLKDAELEIVTVNSSDYRTPSASLSSWLEVSTGSLHSEFSQSRTAAVKLLGEAKTVAKATILDAAVTSLDVSKGTASVIASVNVTRNHSGSTSTVRNRYRATMTRVGGQWKLANLTVVQVSLS